MVGEEYRLTPLHVLNQNFLDLITLFDLFL